MQKEIKQIKITKKTIFIIIVGVILLIGGFLIMGMDNLIASDQNFLDNNIKSQLLKGKRFLYPTYLAPLGSVWVIDGDMIVPIAPGVPSIEKTEMLQKWNNDDFPVSSFNIAINVPLFSQNDPAWKNNVMKTCGLTIGQAGCGLTSTAMTFKYYGTINKNPGQLNTCLGNYACPIYWSNAATSCSESKATFVGSWSFSYNKLYSMLSANRPPIVYMIKGSQTHFVVVRSGSGSKPSNYQINDPWDGQIKQLSVYTNNGWTLTSIREFAKR